jgi:DNA (cytosine-5)-methyltransferase 1
LGTVVAGGAKHALVAAFLAKHFGGHENPGASCSRPFATITCKDHHALVTATLGTDHREEVRAFLIKYYGTSTGSDVRKSMPTICAGAEHLGIVTVAGERYSIVDVGMRMLAPRELFRAQGFDDSYRIDGLTKTAQVRMCGNSVCPPLAAALVRANVADMVRVAA